MASRPILAEHPPRAAGPATMSRRLLLLLLFIGVSSIVGAILLPPLLTPPIAPVPEFSAPDVTSGRLVTMSQLRGGLVIVDFWSISCLPCRVLEHELRQLSADPAWEGKVAIVSVNVDPTENATMIRQFAAQEGIAWAMVDDADGRIQQAYGAPVLPTVLVVDAQGYQTFRRTGIPTLADLEAALTDAAAGTAPRVAIIALPLLALALVGGIASFFSPCAFPLLPAYLVTTLQVESPGGPQRVRRRAARQGAAAAAGLLAVYGLVGIVLVSVGAFIAPALGLLNVAMGILLIGLGGLMFSDLCYHRLTAPLQRMLQRSGASQGVRGSMRGMFAYGAGYGLAASGCTAPLFLAVVAAALTVPLLEGVAAVLLYAGSTAGLMLLAAVVIGSAGVEAMRRLSVHTATIKLLSAAVLVIAGISLVTLFVAERDLGPLGTTVRENPLVQLPLDGAVLIIAVVKAAWQRRAAAVALEVPDATAEEGPQ